jgi:hydrogenase-4 component F
VIGAYHLSPAGLVVVVPLLAAGLLTLPATRAAAGWISIAAAAASFALACCLPWWQGADGLLLVDPPACLLAGLAAFTGLAAAWTAHWSDSAEIPDARRLHARLQAMAGCVLLALLANNLALGWLAVAAATLAASRRWIYLGGAGLALALFGLVVLHQAAGTASLDWSAFAREVGRHHASALDLGFVCLLLGYGGIAGLVPLHGGLLQAQSEGQAPLSAMLGGALMTAALLPLLRFRDLLADHAAASMPGVLLIAFGLLGVLLAGAALWRAGDLRRGLVLAGIGQSGVAVVAFGLGGADAVAAGLWQLALLALIRVVVFSPLGLAAGRARLLTLGAGMLALAGLPPFGLFASLFLIVSAALRDTPWLAPPLCIGLAAIGWALMALLMALPAEPRTTPTPGPAMLALAPAWLALAVLVGFGLGLQDGVADWFAAAAGVLR